MEAFYLKINRMEDYALKNLMRWIDVTYLLDVDCYIICDNNELKRIINETLLLYRDVRFIESAKNDSDIWYIVNNIANRNWLNASYAHLTSFLHSKDKYTAFWNIDADDTRFCVSVDRLSRMLSEIRDCALSRETDCFSLDMWRSETYGKHWSFGVTYVDNTRTDWIKQCKERCRDEAYYKMDKEGNQNVDWFFTYLKEVTKKRIETFYIENMRFIHYSNDFFERPVGSGIYHWEKGKLFYPVAYYALGLKEIGKYDIADDVVGFEFGITEKETSAVIAYYTREGKDLSGYYSVDDIVNDDICEKKFMCFIKKHGFDEHSIPEVVCFGAGNALEKNLNKINKIINLRYVCDNNREMWGKEVANGIRCISPEELEQMSNIIVVILVYSKRIVKQIAEQLDKMCITYDFMDNFLMCVE